MADEISLRKYPPGASILRTDDAATAVYLVVRGTVAVAGRELGPGSMFGEMASLPGQRYQSDANALTATLCVIVPQSKLAALGDALD